MHISHRGTALGAGLAALLVASLPLATARAADIEVGAGASTTTNREFTRIASVAWLPGLRQLDRAMLRGEVGLVHVQGRSGVRGRDLSDDVQVGFVGLRYERSDNGLTLGAGIGAQSGYSDALSGDPQFITTAGWRWQRFSLLLRHISNASQSKPNDGETMLVAGWRF